MLYDELRSSISGAGTWNVPRWGTQRVLEYCKQARLSAANTLCVGIPAATRYQC